MIKISDIAENEIIFYDIESTNQYAAYTTPTHIGFQVGFQGEYQHCKNFDSRKLFKKKLRDPSILKVGYNNKNFDDIVLKRHGYDIVEKNSHDGFLMMKAIAPNLPSYSLKFVNFWFLGDPHFPEMELEKWGQINGCSQWEAPDEIMIPYHKHDIIQHKQVFQLAWEVVQLPRHWEAYLLDLSNGEVVYEMTTVGGLHLDPLKLNQRVATLQQQKAELRDAGEYFSDGRVMNPNSRKQLGQYLTEEGFELALSNDGEFAVKKEDLVDLRFKNDVAACAFETRAINGSLSFLQNYQKALNDTTYEEPNWIPVSFSISGADTRRYISSSMYGLNFQNPNKEAKKVQVVPDGWLGFWWDATQVENVVHIYESEDNIRRKAYEADPNWSEYVWLANTILGCSKTKEELDSIPSPEMPNWSVYKQFKTAKLALNFGMGVTKFCKTTGVDSSVGYSTFERIHDACPAINKLQEKIRKLVIKYGYVQDVFGHCYENTPRMAYKLVAYLIQGCGTGSLPKAQMRSNYDTIHNFDTQQRSAGCLCTTTHDENSGRINLEIGEKNIVAMLQQMNYNMTKKFSPKFDNIPLRAKLYLAPAEVTNADRIEVPIKDITTEFIKKLIL
jgi:hypothetical protein